MHGIRKLSTIQPRLNLVYRWHKSTRWNHWNKGDVYETSAFMSTAGEQPNTGGTQYGKHFGSLLLKLDVSQMPKEYIADVSQLSKFDKEGEVLLVPWLRFTVLQVHDFSDEEKGRWQADQGIDLEFAGVRTAV
uniref:NAD(P)(+)--arginine ADP-ribosyltransferase n=1 Tax=Eutreptiella gymnastica TaxID=73025 RepID=A0A7S4FVV8_9EUGL